MISLRVNRRNPAAFHPKADMRARKIIRRSICTLIALATLIALFYAGEDWRGARELKKTHEAYAKVGETLDYTLFTPAPIPALQNLGALPIFALQPYSPEDPFPFPRALEHALHEDGKTRLLDLPTTGNWAAGFVADSKAIRRGVEKLYAAVFPKVKPPASSLDQLDTLYPFLQNLRDASTTRTECRFESDYAQFPPAERPLSLITYQIKIARLLSLHGILALENHEPKIALDDLRTLFVLSQGAGHDPTLVGTLVAIGMRAIGESVVVKGLNLHAWNDAELSQLQGWLCQFNILEEYQRSLRAEGAEDAANFTWFERHPDKPEFFMGTSKSSSDRFTADQFTFWPLGWFQENASEIESWELKMQSLVDPKDHRVYVDRTKSLVSTAENVPHIGSFVLPSDYLFFYFFGSFQNIPKQFAAAQAWLDQSVIACALERYRLANGKYPLSLGALRPTYLAAVPSDVINGAPPHYRINADDSYLLYSVGWNQKDDGGTVVYNRVGLRRIDYNQGDWVWFGPK
jgi:hypothetical protein